MKTSALRRLVTHHIAILIAVLALLPLIAHASDRLEAKPPRESATDMALSRAQEAMTYRRS